MATVAEPTVRRRGAGSVARSSTLGAALALALGSVCALTLVSRDARAQACCAGGSATTPGRLQAGEDAALALGVRAVAFTGSFDAAGHHASNPSGAAEQDFEESVIGAIRLHERGQLALRLPVEQTRRRLGGSQSLGGGIGDVSVSGRWDALAIGESRRWPGVGLLAGLTAPTGTPIDRASSALLTDVTGTGAFQASLGASVETVVGATYLGATAIGTWSFARTVDGVHEQLGPQGSLLLAAGRVFPRGAAVVATLNALASTDALSGVAAANTGKRLLTAGLAGGLPLDDRWRLQGTLFYDLPAGGKNENAGFGATALLLRAWM